MKGCDVMEQCKCRQCNKEINDIAIICPKCLEEIFNQMGKLRFLLIREVVKKCDIPACGDHPEMYGYITRADGDFGPPHQTEDEALGFFLDNVSK